MQQKLEKILLEALPIESVTEEMSIDNVPGWDSMTHVALIMAIQNEFNVSISPADAIELTDVQSIKEFLQKNM